MKVTYKRLKQLHEIFDHMIVHYGLSKYSSEYPDLIVIHDEQDGCMGMFVQETEEIIINLAKCYRVTSVVNTMIHEYCHYLQPRNGWYDRYARKYKYDDHPYEIQANMMAERDLHLFI